VKEVLKSSSLLTAEAAEEDGTGKGGLRFRSEPRTLWPLLGASAESRGNGVDSVLVLWPLERLLLLLMPLSVSGRREGAAAVTAAARPPLRRSVSL
jgi:hypothetical protein